MTGREQAGRRQVPAQRGEPPLCPPLAPESCWARGSQQPLALTGSKTDGRGCVLSCTSHTWPPAGGDRLGGVTQSPCPAELPTGFSGGHGHVWGAGGLWGQEHGGAQAGKEQQTGDGSVWSGDGTHECVRVSVCAWVCSCTHLYIQACMDVYIHVCVHRGMCEYEGVCTGLCGCTWMWMCACARVPVGAM